MLTYYLFFYLTQHSLFSLTVSSFVSLVLCFPFHLYFIPRPLLIVFVSLDLLTSFHSVFGFFFFSTHYISSPSPYSRYSSCFTLQIFTVILIWVSHNPFFFFLVPCFISFIALCISSHLACFEYSNLSVTDFHYNFTQYYPLSYLNLFQYRHSPLFSTVYLSQQSFFIFLLVLFLYMSIFPLPLLISVQLVLCFPT